MAWLEHAAWPSLTRKRWALGYKLVHLSESNLVIYLSIAVDILEHKERTTHDPVPSSGISAGLANSKHRTLYREARLCRLDSSRACWSLNPQVSLPGRPTDCPNHVL